MKNRRLLLALLIIYTIDSFAQIPDWQWAKSYGTTKDEEGQCIAVDESGNSYVTGYFNYSSILFGSIVLNNTNNNGTSDIFVVKFDASGNVLWAKSAGGRDLDMSTSIAVDGEGNCYVTGYFSSTSINFGSVALTNVNTVNSDIFTVKYNSSGNVIWAKSVGGYSSEQASSIIVDGNGNSFITGSYFSTDFTIGSITLPKYDQGGRDIFIAKYDTAGNVVWAKSAGGASWDEGLSIKADVSGNLYLTGYFQGANISFDSFILTNSNPFYFDLFIVKYNNAGNVLWAKSAGGSDYDWGNSVAPDDSGNCFITGAFQSGSITFGSITLSNGHPESSDIFIVKYDASGNVLWAKSAGGSSSDESFAMATDDVGNSYITGSFRSGSISFGNVTLTNKASNNSEDLFVVKYDPSGNVVWGKSAGGNGNDWSNAIMLDRNNNIYISGSFVSGSIPFGSITIFNSNTTASNIFLAKLFSAMVGVTDLNANNLFTLSPNPANDRIYLTVKADAYGKFYTVYNILGKAVKTGSIESEKTAIDLSHLTDGFYLIGIGGDLIKKFIICKR